jgi:starch synthase
MKIAFVASEVFPFAKTGGLGDVAGALPIEVARLGHDVKVFMPKYNIISDADYKLNFVSKYGEIPVRVAEKVHNVRLYSSQMPGSDVSIYFIDCPTFFCRYEIYTNDKDEDERFILFSKSVIEILQRLQWVPDVIHCNDWQTGLLPILLRENYSWDKLFENTATVFTIHNVAYQGRFSKEAFDKAEISTGHSLPNGIGEFEGDVNFLKTAIFTSDVINTVSETYAKELLTTQYGEGMHEFLSARKEDLYGILNGVNYSIWNPETDIYIPYHYSSENLSEKTKNKIALLKRLNLKYKEDVPVIGIVSRLVEQKGFDLFAYAKNQLLDLDAQWIILGNGEQRYEELLTALATEYPQKVSLYLGFYDELAHLIEAGADIFLMPSRFEPCGLNQIYSLKYGTVPVVRKTGGLADTVHDWNEFLAQGEEIGNGFSFHDYSAYALIHSVKRAIYDFNNKTTWQKIQLNGMKKDFSWKKSAEKYNLLYEKAIQKRRSG